MPIILTFNCNIIYLNSICSKFEDEFSNVVAIPVYPMGVAGKGQAVTTCVQLAT